VLRIPIAQYIVLSVLCVGVTVGCVGSQFASRSTQAANVITSDLAVSYAIQDAQHAKPGEFTCVLQGLPTQINGAQIPYGEARHFLGALADPVSGDDRPIWLIVLRGDIVAQSNVPPPLTITPQVYQQMSAIVDAGTGTISETTCRPTTSEVPTDTLPALTQPQGTLPSPPLPPERVPASPATVAATNTAVPPQVVPSSPTGGP